MQGVVFSGTWDDRQTEIRCDDSALHAELEKGAKVLPLWRGRVLLAGDTLGWLDAGHPVLDHAHDERLFLGRHQDHPRLAADISSWEPPGLDRAAMAMFFDSKEYRHPELPADHRFVDLRGAMTRLDPAEGALAATGRALVNWHRTHGFCSACGAPSELHQGGWQRKCPACGAHHFPRTDPVAIMLVRHGNRVLLGRSPGWPEGMYSTLAGFIEPGETPETAVRREVLEETGIHVANVRYIAAQPWPFPNSLMLGFVAEAKSDKITLDHELEDARWLTREDMVTVNAGLHPEVKAPRRGAIAHHLIRAWLSGSLD
ncbi:NAD(+) diphosphatase [Pararhodobacter sp. SW119]|uniref:NAD(+) diphosphatase n=1 Tax=Pararhodobacter sp. SW119 TaxID=2780075 RepID=UPI001ADF41EE|nr:NAD(+) diphosphatase [Pararhodobacter sp. SW119]